MSRPQVRIRQEEFGFTLAFASGTIGFYRPEAGALLLQGTSENALEPYRLETLPVGDNFHLAGPLVAWIELTRACNLPCKHCYISAGRPRENEMSTEEACELLDQLHAQGVFVVVFLGGEPLLHPGFVDIVRHAHGLGMVVSIGSNGVNVTQELIDQLPKDDVFFSVSLDGIGFQKEMRVHSTYEQIRDKLLLLRSNNVPTGVMCVITERNIEEVEQILDFAIEHDLYFGSTPFSPIGRGRFFPELTPTPRIAGRSARLYERDEAHEAHMMAKTGLCFTKFFYQCYILSRAIRREFCGISLVYIQSDGQVFPCTTCSSVGRHRAGSLREQSFAEIWEHGFRELRNTTWDDFKGCKTCDLATDEYFCTSRCPVMSEVLTGDPLQCGSTPYLQQSLRLRNKPTETGC
ncbi:MAG: radical SAM protein [Deltaproteobacteria bacterium]|nr:radical SAM protein [Deltaproteobacteria bacterium]